jgi:hypothetical protein
MPWMHDKFLYFENLGCYTHVYFWYTPCLTDFTFEFIWCPISPILSPSSRKFVELTLIIPRWRFLMIHIYLQWQEPAWDSKSSSMRFGYSYFTGHEVFNLWFVKHMLHNCTRINSNHLRCLWWGQWELKASKYHNFWRFIKLAITASLCEGPFFYFYVESSPSTFMHHLREHSCHS